VIGGSQGARKLNTVVPEAIGLMPVADRPQVIHQAGAKLIAEMAGAYQAQGVSADVRPFIEDMATELSAADVVICRAGALTVSELAAVGVASILIPFPLAVDDHQTLNARFLSEAGGGILLPQSELTGEVLAKLLLSLHRERLQWMAKLAKGLARIHATEDVMSTVMTYSVGGAR
jgi:UDP-N-acetylglucosamine--N-acetylmuramyl-(pentapeptide) pyrophosphoryl-undecaprenol N-acetylglucosamine transferase